MKKKTNAKAIALTIMSSILFVSCTKEKPAAFPDGQGKDILDKQMVQDAQVSITTESEAQSIKAKNDVRFYSEKPQVKVIDAKGHPELLSMFKDLMITGEQSKTYTIVFSVDASFLTAYKLVDKKEDLSTTELQISTINQKYNKLQVAIFQYPIQGYGTIVRVKNDLNEETSSLRVEATELKNATHIQISTLNSNRILVGVPSSEQQTADRIFNRKKIDQVVFSRKFLNEEMQIQVSMPDESLFFTELNDETMSLYHVTDLNSLDESERAAVLAKDEAAMKRHHLKSCTEQAVISAKANSETCILKLKYFLDIRPVVAKRRAVQTGVSEDSEILSAAIEFVQSDTTSNLIQIVKFPSPALVNPVELAYTLDPSRVLSVDDLRGQEFLFRRTLQDTPNGFDYTFTGAAGNLELVKFVFEQNRVKIVRSEALLSGNGNTAVDLETIVSIPATYKKLTDKDAAGNRLPIPQLLTASHTEAGALAFVDWTQNSIPNVSSALDYYGLEQCFAGVHERQISEAVQETKSNSLSFSLSTTYSSNPSIDCAGLYSAGYFDTVQANFTFKERFSFKKYIKTAKEEVPLLNVPYEAQKRLGFGLFTYHKANPNSFGNTGVDGTEVPLPALFDIRDGKKIIYVLAGLPQSGSLRAKLIDATKQVVSDWNKAYRLALHGTSLERKSDIIELRIEGDDGKETQIGDLNKNMIYYVQKKTSSGVIGIGGAHHNPRSGEVENASVFIYGGNIMSTVETMKKMSLAQKQYDEILNLSVKNTVTEASPTLSEFSATGSNASAGSHLTQAKDFIKKIGQLKPTESLSEKVISKIKTASKREIQKIASSITEMKDLSVKQKNNLYAELSKSNSEFGLFEAIQSAVAGGYLHDSNRVEANIQLALKKALSGKVPAHVLKKLDAKANQLKALSRVFENLEKANYCVYESRQVFSEIGHTSIDELDDEDALIAIYKPTLAHELGHNLGLRHNFIASFDKENWKFSEDEKSSRTYSSVMDYLADDHDTYDGVGPQDVSSLRAAYAGLLELSESVIQQLPEVDGKKVIPLSDGTQFPLIDNKDIGIEDYRRLIGLKSWLNLDSQAISRLPLKQFQFCSDEDAGTYPACNRFDKGSTPQEIVQNAAKDYNAFYSLRNFADNKLNYTYWDVGSYIGRLFRTMIPVRQFLEETIYQLIIGGDFNTVVLPNLDAAIEGLQFFHQIVRTPDAPLFSRDDERYLMVDLSDGSQIPIERKYLKDVAIDSNTDRILARGIEFDKVIALIMLTQRQMGFARYEQVSLRLSYPELERMLFEGEPQNMPTLSLLDSVLKNKIEPIGVTRLGLVGLGNDFKAETTEMMRFYAILGGISNLDVDGLEVTANHSSLFRVMSGFTPPKGVEALLPLGASAGTGNELSYWSGDRATVAQTMISNVSDVNLLMEMKSELGAYFMKWFTLKLSTLQSAETTASSKKAEDSLPKDDLAKLEDQINKELAKLPNGVGIKKMSSIGEIMMYAYDIASQIDMYSQIIPARQMALIVDSLLTSITNEISSAPILGIALGVMLEQEEGMPASLGRIVPSRKLESDRDEIFSNLRTLNQFFYILHPEYSRR